jgi:hypothetical protein
VEGTQTTDRAYIRGAIVGRGFDCFHRRGRRGGSFGSGCGGFGGWAPAAVGTLPPTPGGPWCHLRSALNPGMLRASPPRGTLRGGPIRFADSTATCVPVQRESPPCQWGCGAQVAGPDQRLHAGTASRSAISLPRTSSPRPGGWGRWCSGRISLTRGRAVRSWPPARASCRAHCAGRRPSTRQIARTDPSCVCAQVGAAMVAMRWSSATWPRKACRPVGVRLTQVRTRPEPLGFVRVT